MTTTLSEHRTQNSNNDTDDNDDDDNNNNSYITVCLIITINGNTCGRFHSMLVAFGLLQNSDLMLGGNSGSLNSEPDDFARFFRAAYF